MLYVAPDGNYGEAEYLVVVDDENFDEHFVGYLDHCSDWLRPSYAKWFEDNQHDFEQGSLEWECQVCEVWLSDVS
jgi:hypothetical protein